MKKIIASMLGVFIAVPLLLAVWGFALPAQYSSTFLGELPAKRALLAAESNKPRLILVGGSAAAFGVDSTLLAKELPDYHPVNFGLYAALGTRVMLDLSINELRAGDIVIVMPEQQQQALSDTVGVTALWQAVDGDFSALGCLHARDFGPMLGSFPRFAAAKLRYFLTGAPETDGIYRRDSFNAAGDLASPLCKANIMPEGYDPTMPIRFDTALPEAAFCAALNDYTARAADAGAAVYYHFPPMNALAVANEDQLNAYAAHLQQVIAAPLAGDPRACVMESGWFYDTNFHLNTAGRTVFTRQLIRDIKAMLGDTTATEIALPAMPEPAANTTAGSGSSTDAAYFTMAEDGSVTVNAAGRARRSLTVPAEINGRAAAVTAAIADLRFMCVYSPFLPNLCGIVCAFRSASPEARPLYRISVRVSTMVRYNRGKAFAKTFPVLCGNGKVCKEYAKQRGQDRSVSSGGVRAPRPTHGFQVGS